MKTGVIFLICIIAVSCSLFDDGADVHNEMWVYKTKADYSNNVCVQMNAEKTEIYATKGSKGKWPVSLIDGYQVDKESLGINTAYLSITFDEFAQNGNSISIDSMKKIILDKNPFLEYYECDNYKDHFYIYPTEGGYYGVDTAKINEVIRKGELKKYFKRVL